MKKTIKKEPLGIDASDVSLRFDANIENFKRRRALPPVSPLDIGSRLFFERILNVKKIREFIFITKGR